MSGRERVGTAQRTVVLESLSRAVGEGYLDLDEYEVRVARVTESKTVAQLYATVADLPPQFRWDPNRAPRNPEARARETVRSMAVAALALGATSIPLSLCFGAGGIAGVIGLVFARIGMADEESRSKAVIGLVLSIVGIALSLAVVVGTLLT